MDQKEKEFVASLMDALDSYKEEIKQKDALILEQKKLLKIQQRHIDQLTEIVHQFFTP